MQQMAHFDFHQAGSIETFMAPIEEASKCSQKTDLYGVPLKIVEADKLLQALTKEMKKGNCWQMSQVSAVAASSL